MGGGALKPRALDIEGAEDFDNVHYQSQASNNMKDNRWPSLAVGTYVDWALAFDKIAPTTIVHRRGQLHALEHSVEELKQSSVSIKTPFVPSRLIGEKWSCHLSCKITKVKSMNWNHPWLITYLSTMALNLQSNLKNVGCRIATP